MPSKGLGDTIQFVRYAPLVAARGGRVVLEVQPALARLLVDLPGVAQVITQGASLPGFDCHVPLMSLPALFGTTTDAVLVPAPYLVAPANGKKPLAAALTGPAGVRRIGVVWGGNRARQGDAVRSCRAADLAPLATLRNVRLFSLQKGSPHAEQAVELPGAIELGPLLDDMADTACAISRLDLVVSVDTATAHLAGALGRPVATMLAFAADWRYMLHRSDSLWYPTMTLYRQERPGAWAGVVERISARGSLPACSEPPSCPPSGLAARAARQKGRDMAGTARFHALVANKAGDVTVTGIQEQGDADLPPGNVTVRVAYSSLNYKDGLALTGRAPILRAVPMVPGVDFAGTVEASDDPRFNPGEVVVLTGWGVGERHPGGFTQKTRLNAEWLVHLPKGMSAKRAMAIGTAGFTSMLCVLALERAGVTPGAGPVVVTGAAGGVGSVAIALLAKRGYEVHAVTGRPALEGFLKSLGATQIVPRAELSAKPDKPMLKERWAGAVDTVGGDMLAHVIAETRYGGAVAACGLAGGTGLNITVLPFILRGVSLLGVDSVMCPHEPRVKAWKHLAKELPAGTLDTLTEVIALKDLPSYAVKILKGEIKGRVVVDVNA